MVFIRWCSAAILAGVLVLASSPLRAEEQPAPPEPPKTPPPADAGAGKPPWWGGRNLLYLQIDYGQSSFDTIDSSVWTEAGNFSYNQYEIDGTTSGRFTVGWTLPDGRGRFSVAYDGVKEDSYKFTAVGMQASVLGGDSNSSPVLPIPWWAVAIRKGQLEYAKVPPEWNGALSGPDCGSGCDRNGDGRASFDEVFYDFENPALLGGREVPKSLNNKFTTLDFLYGREFGGRRLWGSWTAGGRYFKYDGTIPVAAWLVIAGGDPGNGFTDGVENRILSFRQDTKGFGPTGSLGINFGFFRRKLVLHADARVVYALSSLKTDTGDFYTLIFDPEVGFIQSPANLRQSIDKSVWQLQAEASVTFEVAPGLNLIARYQRSGMQDVMIYPVSMSVPDQVSQIPQGALGVYGTRDLRFQTVTAGLSYQF